MRYVVGSLFLLHGAVHLAGWLGAWKLSEKAGLGAATFATMSGPLRRALGAGWLAVGLVLLLAAALELAGREAWWKPAAIGLVLSQVLILVQGSEAKAGTWLNVLLLVPTLMGFGIARFHQANESHCRALLATASAPLAGAGMVSGALASSGPRSAPVLTAQDLATLPPPVRRWVAASGALGRPRATTVFLRQRGQMRTSPQGRFMPAEARQVFTVQQPGFVWTVDVTMFGVLPVVGRDSYRDGHGRMYIRAGGLVTVADGTGPRFDEGTLLRWLGELVWFPSGASSPAVRWEAVDDHAARATVIDQGVTASALFRFDAQDRPVELSAKRYFNGETLEDWVIPMSDWRPLRGITVPTKGTAIWKLAAGDFEYYRWEILDVETNVLTPGP